MLVCVGLDQKCAEVGHREALAASPEELAAILRAHAALGGVDEIAALSTCFRVEVYAATRFPVAAVAALRRALCERAGSPDLPLLEMRGEAALRHLARVSAGLESAVLGEPQILGQVKEAFARASESGAVGRELATAFHRAFHVARRVRAETAIGRAGVSWGTAAGTLAEKVLGSLRGRRVVVVGAGEMARLSALHLREAGAEISVLNRTPAHAEALAAEVGGTSGPLEDLARELRLADVVVSAAPATPADLEPQAVARLMRARAGRRLVLVDLAVPRAVPAAAGRLEGVYLCDVDDLARLSQASLEERSAAAAEAERVVDDALRRFAREDDERRAAPIIAALRSRAQSIAGEEVARTLRCLGDDPELEARLRAMAGAIVAKLLHAPSARLRRAGGDGRGGESMLAAARAIFGLEAPVERRP